jgi:hypothetical protein
MLMNDYVLAKREYNGARTGFAALQYLGKLAICLNELQLVDIGLLLQSLHAYDLGSSLWWMESPDHTLDPLELQQLVETFVSRPEPVCQLTLPNVAQHTLRRGVLWVAQLLHRLFINKELLVPSAHHLHADTALNNLHCANDPYLAAEDDLLRSQALSRSVFLSALRPSHPLKTWLVRPQMVLNLYLQCGTAAITSSCMLSSSHGALLGCVAQAVNFLWAVGDWKPAIALSHLAKLEDDLSTDTLLVTLAQSEFALQGWVGACPQLSLLHFFLT